MLVVVLALVVLEIAASVVVLASGRAPLAVAVLGATLVVPLPWDRPIELPSVPIRVVVAVATLEALASVAVAAACDEVLAMVLIAVLVVALPAPVVEAASAAV